MEGSLPYVGFGFQIPGKVFSRQGPCHSKQVQLECKVCFLRKYVEQLPARRSVWKGFITKGEEENGSVTDGEVRVLQESVSRFGLP